MPYIDREAREILEPYLKPLLDHIGEGTRPGWINYIISRILVKTSQPTYARYNDLMGVMSSAQHEFYRRHVAPYEDNAKARNGDVYA